VLVGLADTTSHGGRPGERKARLLLEVLRDRPDDVLRFGGPCEIERMTKEVQITLDCADPAGLAAF